MCVNCQTAFTLLRRDGLYSKDETMGFLWSITPFPFGDPLPEIKRFLRVQKKNRRRWILKQDNRIMRMLRETS